MTQEKLFYEDEFEALALTISNSQRVGAINEASSMLAKAMRQLEQLQSSATSPAGVKRVA